MAKKSLKKKIKSNKLTMQEVVISLFVVLVLGISISVVSSFAVNVFAQEKNVNSNSDHQDQEELKESPYTLDEIYDFISSKEYWQTKKYDKNWIDFNYVLTHFYEYFSKDTKFMIYDKKISPYFDDYAAANDAGVLYINYDEYMKIAYDYETGGIINYIRWGEEKLKEQSNYSGNAISNAAKEIVGSCNIVNKCANPEENDNYKKEGNV